MAPLTWRLAGLFTQHALLVGGLGRGEMPVHAVVQDIAEGRLVAFAVQGVPPGRVTLPLPAI
ncbi:hypothetical protein [Xanthomonas hortorum]|uniref:hypothetical protein n=1 Tax=Xanthomonas hortorum TaxID=56454 RepID=UPI0029354A58|nr:hypothetical protein [Xanthomonas hortorum]MDV2453247.1 hypothetical protein [Xanthomonas hortorum NBC5720]